MDTPTSSKRYSRPRSRALLVNGAAFVVVVAGISAAKILISPLLLAIFLAIILAPLLYRLRQAGVSAVLAILLLVLVILGVEIGVATLIGTSLADFSRGLPQYQAKLMERFREMLLWLNSYGVQIDEGVLQEHVNPGKIMGLIANSLNTMAALLANTLLILFTFAFIMLEAAGFPNKLKAISGDANFSLDHFRAISLGVHRYLIIRTLNSIVTGILVSNMLLFYDIQYAAMWGLVAFFLNFVPNIGSIIASVPGMLLALVQFGPGKALIVVFWYLVINNVISNVLEPRMLGVRVGLSTLVVFTSMIFWGWVLGPVGMLLSVPLTMTCKIALAGNDGTRWIAILLGTDHEAEHALRERFEEGKRST